MKRLIFLALILCGCATSRVRLLPETCPNNMVVVNGIPYCAAEECTCDPNYWPANWPTKWPLCKECPCHQ